MICTKSPRYEFSTTCGCCSCERTRAAYVERVRELSRARMRAQRRELAAARREAPPDWAMVDRILAEGPQPGARRKERRAAVAYLLAHGRSHRVTAEQVGITPKSVERIAARIREESNEHQGLLVASA